MDSLEQILGTLFATAATQITRQALASDPILRSRLLKLAGNTVQFECTLPAPTQTTTTWQLAIEDTELIFSHGQAAQPNAIVRGSLASLARWLLPGSKNNDVEIEGDETLLVDMMEVIAQFQPDIESKVSQFLGQQTASSLLGSAEMGLKGFQSALEGIGRSFKTQATGNFVQQQQFNSLLTGIDDLRLRVDRLAASITAKEQRLKPHG